jgi:hypothetical protein
LYVELVVRCLSMLPEDDIPLPRHVGADTRLELYCMYFILFYFILFYFILFYFILLSTSVILYVKLCEVSDFSTLRV